MNTKFCLDNTVTVTGGTSGVVSASVSLTDLAAGSASVASYANLYQQYSIRKIKVNFFPRGVGNQTFNNNAAATLQHGGRGITVLDFTDVAAPTALTQFERSAYRRLHSLNAPFSRYFTPKAQLVTEQTGSSARSRLWISTADLGVEHYGLKAVFTAPGPNTSLYYIDIVTTVYVQFKESQ